MKSRDSWSRGETSSGTCRTCRGDTALVAGRHGRPEKVYPYLAIILLAPKHVLGDPFHKLS